jgi:hypothetical protein
MKFVIYSYDSTATAHYINKNNFTCFELMSVDTESPPRLCLYQPLPPGPPHLVHASLRTEHAVTATATPVSGKVDKYCINLF